MVSAATLRLHPNLADVSRKKIEKLEEAPTDSATAKDASDIIQRIVLTPVGGTLPAELYGDLATRGVCAN